MAQTTGFTVWLTGMSGTGKSTMAAYIAARLRQVGRNVEVLDERELADELWQGLGDSKEDRSTIMRRLGYVAGVLARNDVAVLVACVSPYKSVREEIRRASGKYVEVYADCPTETLIERDSTGRYKKALSGEIPNFIGITEPYEPPSSPEVTIHSDMESVEEGGTKIFQSLLDLGCVTGEELKVITGKKMKANPVPTRKARTEKARVEKLRPVKARTEKARTAKARSTKARPTKARTEKTRAVKTRTVKVKTRPAARVTKAAKPGKGSKARPASRAARVAKITKKASSRRKSR